MKQQDLANTKVAAISIDSPKSPVLLSIGNSLETMRGIILKRYRNWGFACRV
ncbi:hypothetical protein [Paraflavitalea speifideaquila]|uniref:hypothetical protein n=1 Tax=Paraflavitalea speifideaquila TaxID=3076558 RepID=UPI0028E58136|nr:hypothetical protein [Paraflavitalea speifideiaquila]